MYRASMQYAPETNHNGLTIVQSSPGKGLGLFATMDISKGTVVAQMRSPARMKKAEWELHIGRNRCLPHDAAIYLERSPLVFYDQSWQGEHDNVPLWYRLNHSSSPNTTMQIVDRSAPAREQRIAWVTIRDVRRGEELTFVYSDVPAGWMR